METWLTIGKITGVHGLGGNLKVWSYAESPDTFAKGRQVRLRDEGGDPDICRGEGEFKIARVSPRKKGVLLSLEGINTREASEALIGKEILIDKNELPELDDQTWYWEDLFGLIVRDLELGELGKIERIFPTGADDILVVKDKSCGEKEILIPMNEEFVRDVDIETGVVTTSLPPGFILE